MGLLIIFLLPLYTGLFYHFVLHFYWAIPIDILIALILDVLTIFLIILVMIVITKHLKPDNKFTHAYLRSLFRVACFFMRVSYKYEGLENIPNGPFVLFPNHKSYADILILFMMVKRPISFISKPENFNIPLVGKYMENINCIGLNRDNDREAATAIIKGIKNIKAGYPMIIFPEGGIKSRADEHMFEAKAGAYKLAMKPQVPVVPVTLIGMTKIKNNFPWKKSKVKAIVHKPITYEEYQDLNTHELGERVREIVNSAL